MLAKAEHVGTQIVQSVAHYDKSQTKRATVVAPFSLRQPEDYLRRSLRMAASCATAEMSSACAAA